MSLLDHLLLASAGLVAGVINAVSSGGSFFTYPALLGSGLTPLQAATSTLAAGVGHLFLALLTIRGFGDFLSANAAKNVVLTLGTTGNR